MRRDELIRRARVALDHTAAVVDGRIAPPQPSTLAVLGAAPSEGATTVSLGLCHALSTKYGRRVLLVEANGTEPAILDHLHENGLDGGEIATDPTLPEGLRRAAINPNMTCLAWARPVADSVQRAWLNDVLLRTAPMPEGVDLLVIDLPPVLVSADAAATAGRSDATVFVAAAARQRASVHMNALHHLRLHDAEVIGLVFNRVRDRVPRWLSGRWT